jgi:hypothetical protein
MVRPVQIACFAVMLFSLNLTLSGITESYSSSSVLSSGKWFKIAVTEDNIYRIDFSRLKQLGMDYPSNPRIFGNNHGQLSYFNDGSGPDDLKEIAIYTFTGSDGIFNEGDYLLFYGKGTNRWIYDNSTGNYNYLRHNYSDTAFYFITSGPVQGKRIVNARGSLLQPNYSSASSDALYMHEKETDNLLHSGREWYQPASYSKDSEVNPGFKDIVTADKIKYTIRVLARASVSTLFRFTENGSVISTVPVSGINLSSTTGTYAQAEMTEGEFVPSSSQPAFKVSFVNNGEISAKGWIDYVKLHARRLNKFDGVTSSFTDSKSSGNGIVTEFTIKSLVEGTQIWDVTDPVTPQAIQYTRTGENIIFKLATDTLRSFIAFLSSSARTPVISSAVLPNQDLHSSPAADMIIVTHPLFISYALRLAEMHRKNSGLASLVVTPEQIYNEFSGGIPDIVAIRNFMRMKFLLQKGTDHPLKYLLLFGDGSFENKTPPPGNMNYVPTYQTQNSNIIISSFTSDDFYGLLENGEGEDSGTEDLGIGRIPVSDTTEAGIVISKIEGYMSPANQGDWKNVVCITADDEDGNTHMSDAEGLAALVAQRAPWVNIDKIYFDAYNQVTTSTGQFYPDVTKAISDRINSGTLVFNYIGHGNETSLAHERVITSGDIDRWQNISKLPLFITATCEFSRFDDITINSVTGGITGKPSSGEKILLYRKGGAIALMSTTRLVYSAPNYALNRNIFNAAFDLDQEGKALRLGDIIRIAKNMSGNNTNKRNFLLLGDPALRLSYPWHGNVVTDSVNNVPAGGPIDTLKALSLITVTGHIEDNSGNLTADFNGIVIPVVFGKPSEIQTLANDGGQKMKFKEQNNILFSGKTRAENGKFRFTFIVPRDIDYLPGMGKISYYANDEVRDVKGNFSRIVTGGFNNKNIIDTEGPAISLYINDTLFRSGGITDSNPRLLALIEDIGGINTSGTGIGHDLSFWIDNDRAAPYILNNYFENDFGSYSKGSLIYNLSGLDPGSHTITLKVWDNFNNSSEKSINFLVEKGEKFILKNLINYPNPFIEGTRISAEHNRPDDMFDITITIFSLNGLIIRILKTNIPSTGYQLAPVEWDGNTSGGQRAGRGVYPYRVTITAGNGETCTISGRMIIY